MSFTIILQSTSSPNNKLDKEITTLATLTGTLKDGTSVMEPTFRVNAQDFNPQNSIFTCNYLTCNVFHRKYFITNIESVRNNIIDISCHCDVLTTYKDSIRQQYAIVRRQENQWNLYLDDGILKTYNNPNFSITPFPSGFTTQEFLLAVAGG